MREVVEQEQALVRRGAAGRRRWRSRGGAAHGEGLEGEAEAEHVGEGALERPRPAPAPLQEDQRRLVQTQRDGRVPASQVRAATAAVAITEAAVRATGFPGWCLGGSRGFSPAAPRREQVRLRRHAGGGRLHRVAEGVAVEGPTTNYMVRGRREQRKRVD
jgi:hypothetical protein